MSIDNLVALRARDDLLYIVHKWPDLEHALSGVGGKALTGMPSGTETPLPLDVGVSDLMREIEDKIARHYGHILLDETDDWAPTTSTMPGLLRDVANRYGHFTTDPELAQGFCDDAHDYRHRVTKTLERPTPPTYVGPCPHMGTDGSGCDGELYVREDQIDGTCGSCGQPWTLVEQHDYLEREMANLRLTYTDTWRALKILDKAISVRTWERWTSAGTPDRPKTPKIAANDEGLYSLAEAITLATRRTA